MPNIIPYIDFAGKGQQAVAFYKAIFGGDADVQLDGDRIVQLEFRADGIHFMGSDLQDGTMSSGGNLVLNCDSEAQLRDFYAKLVDGGTAVFEPADSGWGAIIAHCTDQFGITWMLNYDR